MREFHRGVLRALCLGVFLAMRLAEATPVPIDPDATPETRVLLQKLHAQAGRGVLFGHQDTTAYGVGWQGEPGRSDVKSVCGAFPAVYGWDLGDIHRENNLDGVAFADMKRWIREADARGGINTISLHLDHPVTGRNAWDNTWVVEDLLPDGETHETYLRTWDRVAAFLKELRRSDGTMIPVILRPYHEHSERWPWWGRPNCHEDDFIALWRMTVDHLREKCGVHNVLYAISPQDVVDESDYLDGYPGDHYVDIFGLDYYKIWRQREITQMGKILSMVAKLAHARGKISALTETGIDKVLVSNVWTEHLLTALAHDEWSRKTVWALLWRNKSRGHHFGPYPGHGSADDFLRFYEDPLTVFGERDLQFQGFSTQGLDRIEAEQRAFIDEGLCLSNTALIGRQGQLVYSRTTNSEMEGDRPIDSQTLFAIWSMTKPVTSVAAMILHERGAFQLDDPVEKIIPALGRLKVKIEGDSSKTEAIKTPMTYRHLLTHTAGFYGYDGSFHEQGTWKEVMELQSLSELIDLLESKPLEHQPGARYTYGLSTAVLGRAIEVISGKSLQEFLEDEIFNPLGMSNTRFYLTPEDRERFQPLFVQLDDQGFRPGTPAEDELYYDPESQLYLGGEGLVSSLSDFGRFCQVLADGGRPILKPETLSLMLQDQLGSVPGYGGAKNESHFGLGFYVTKESSPQTGVPSGLFGWGGYHNTHFWIDPRNQLYAVFLARRYPSKDASLKRFRQAIYAALEAEE